MNMTLQRPARFAAVLLLVTLGIPDAKGQVMASIDKPSLNLSTEQNFQSLRDFLSGLEKRFDVYFTFKSSVVRDKQLMKEVLISGSLEEILEHTLAPLNLKFEKVSDKYYTIYKKEDPGNRENP